ncbi:PTS system mannose/fructose/sorbose family transporter subunit IID [Deltaproteobacteria bacterium OttesenSCG-928-M10]|nr:PTS system mannose/fructose/sorbose family transporter subunit IID [Deltaproteobacteria bacterium OttesenSCG-928-M10]
MLLYARINYWGKASLRLGLTGLEDTVVGREIFVACGESLNFLTMAGVALRSLFLEASWNNEGQQNLGLAASIDPALRKIHHSPDSLRAARERALGFFNTNPIASGPAIGAMIRMEEEVAAGLMAASERDRVEQNLTRTLAAMGDSIFWQSWLPMCCLTAVWAVLSLDFWWTPLLLPATFCLLAVPVRFIGLYLGYCRGQKIFDLLFKLKIQLYARALKRSVALLVGASTVILVNGQAHDRGGVSLGGLWITMAAVVATVVFFRFVSSRTKILNYWYPIFLVTLAVILLAAWDKMNV